MKGIEKVIGNWNEVNERYRLFINNVSASNKIALFYATSIIEIGLEGVFLEDKSNDYNDKSKRLDKIFELIDDFINGISKKDENTQTSKFNLLIDLDLMKSKLDEFLNWLSDNSTYKKTYKFHNLLTNDKSISFENVKARFFYADAVHSTWQKLFVLTKDGKFYCEYLDYMKPVSINLEFDFTNFKSSDYKWGGYQSIIEIDESAAKKKNLTKQENWIKSYLSRIN